jgi:hypothetical protein
VDDSADSSPRACTSSCSQRYGLEPEHQRSLEMGGIGGRGPSTETATRRVNLGITIKWECRRIEEPLNRKAKADSVIRIQTIEPPHGELSGKSHML